MSLPRLRRCLLLSSIPAVAALAVLACTAADPTLDTSSTTDGATRAEASAAPPDSGNDDVGDAADDGAFVEVSGGLLVNGDFERGDCDRWGNNSTKLTGYTIRPSTDRRSCLVCADSSRPNSYSTSQLVSLDQLPPPKSGNYRASVDIRLPDDGHTQAQEVYFAALVDQGSERIAGQEQLVDLTTEWKRFESTVYLDVDAGDPTNLELLVINRRLDQGCFVLDHAVLERVP